MNEITNFQGEATTNQQENLIDEAVSEVIIRVGDRVRNARELKGISRRILSEVSGVSPRYLAQLEGGEGNISIGLLQRVAVALDYKIEWLIGEEDPWNSEALHVGQLFKFASTDLQEQVLEILTDEPATNVRANRICLIGLRGAGKSTLGAMAGKALKVPFVELNKDIEEQSGMPISEVMAFFGQDGYRKLEAQAINRIISTHETIILAVAGGVVAEPDTFNTLLNYFHTIWLKATPEEHMARVKAQGDDRPMSGNPEAMAQLQSILTSREVLYQKALSQVDTSGQTIDESLDALKKLIKEENYLP